MVIAILVDATARPGAAGARPRCGCSAAGTGGHRPRWPAGGSATASASPTADRRRSPSAAPRTPRGAARPAPGWRASCGTLGRVTATRDVVDPRVDRLDRHPGDRRRRAPTRTGSGSSGSPPAAASVALLAAQALELGVEVVAVARASAPRRTCSSPSTPRPRPGATPRASSRSRRSSPGRTRRPSWPSWPCDVVLNGDDRLDRARARRWPRCGRAAPLALANKESLIAGGPLVKAAVRRPDQIVPVDSEHSALAQCLRGGRPRRGRAGWC